jgi:hypothetical protein
MKQMSDLNDLIATNSINAFNQGVQTGVRQEQERIIKLLEEMPWQIYQGVAQDGKILELPTPKVLDREAVIALIKGEK